MDKEFEYGRWHDVTDRAEKERMRMQLELESLKREKQKWYKFARWVGEVYPDAKKQYEAIMDIERSVGNE